MFSIQRYSYTRESLLKAQEVFLLDLDPEPPVEMGLKAYLHMRKSLNLANRLIKDVTHGGSAPQGITPAAQAKAKRSIPSGARWITIHPRGEDGKGVPILIQDDGNGHAHVIAGAGGKLNMLKLNKIKSPEEYKTALKEKREKEKATVADAREKKKAELASMDDTSREKVKLAEQAAKLQEKTKAVEKKSKREEATKKLLETFTAKLGWEQADFDDDHERVKRELKEELAVAKEDGDKEKVKKISKEIHRLDQGVKRAKKSQEQHAVTTAKELVRDFQRRLLLDPETRAIVEQNLGGGKTGAEDLVKKENQGKSKGFVADYRGSAEKQGLTKEALAEEKEEVLSDHLAKLAEESPETADFVAKGIQANREINAVRRDFYGEKEELPTVADLDTKTELLKTYLEYKKALAEADAEENGKPVTQVSLDGTPEEIEDKVDRLQYGNGTKLDYSELLADELEDEAVRMFNERQADVNKSLLDAIEKNPGGSEKWVANGNYNGLNSIALQAMKTEGIDRDVVDILGVANAAKVQAMMMRRALSPDEYDAVAQGMESYHQAMSESMAKEAVTQADDLLARAESIKLDIANNPDDLATMQELNETRLQYLDEANRIAGQALGSLEAAAAMVVELGSTRDPAKIDVNMGGISTEDAIVRLRSLGLQKGDYEIDTFGGGKLVTIKGEALEKLMKPVSAEDIAVENEVAAIKAGARDEDGWLPDGVVYRPFESFKDPGPDAPSVADSVDNQAIENDDNTREALHRTLGELPEAKLGYADFEDLSLQDKGELRKYWETHIYKGTAADDTHGYGIHRGQDDGQGETAQKVWNDFVREKGGEEAAVAAIKEHMGGKIESGFDLGEGFDTADRHPVLDVKRGDYDTYRRLLTKDDNSPEAKDVRYLRDRIGQLDDMSRHSEEQKDEHAELKAELNKAWDSLLDKKTKDYYLETMSGKKIKAGDRFEESPWGEYLRVHGGPEKAMQTVQDVLRGHVNEAFAKNYSRVTGKRLKTDEYNVRNSLNHTLGMMDAPTREEFMRKMKYTGSAWQARARHDFEGGLSWKKREELTPEQRRKLENVDWRLQAMEHKDRVEAGSKDQDLMFGDEPGTTMADKAKAENTRKGVSLGDRVEGTLKSIMPEAAANQRKGQKFGVFPGMSMSKDKGVVRQRAIKMFEATKRMNLTFGTGTGKTIISIGAFTHLKGKGKAKRGIFAVPSVVQAQFGNEGNVFLKPGKYKWSSNPGMSQAERIQALKDGKLDMVVATHQSLRDDMIHIMAKQAGQDEEAFKDDFNAATPEKRKELLGAALKAEGIDFDMLTVDESHYTVNRKGKDNATLANVMDALGQHTPYFMNQSATPVKNDISEAFDFLKKVAPDRFTDRDEFIKKYGVDSKFSKTALQRLINRYSYANPSNTGVKRTMTREEVKLHPDQQAEYDQVEKMFKRASQANAEGKVDVEAMKYLSPNSFKGRPEVKHEEIARELQKASGTIKEEALNRAVNQFDHTRNAKIDRLNEIIGGHKYDAPNSKTASKAGDRKPGIVFAHNIQTVENIRQALESKGHRVGVIQGSMSGAEKDKVKNGFNPVNPKDRIYDVIVLSDAGATGISLQNAGYFVNFDLPQTSWVKQQREGRMDRIGQAHEEIHYHDLVSDTDHEKKKWDRIERKKALGSVFEEDPGQLDDTGLLAHIQNARAEKFASGEGKAA